MTGTKAAVSVDTLSDFDAVALGAPDAKKVDVSGFKLLRGIRNKGMRNM